MIELYKNFYNALKPGGTLITSFLTPPPAISYNSPWKNYDPEALIKQKAIFGDVIGSKWQNFRTEEETRSQLEKADFKVVDVIYDHQQMFPTIIATKEG